MGEDKIRSVISEAKELGILLIVLAGGEPLVRKEILEITTSFPEMIFFLFTNGLLFNGELIAKIKKQKNLIPVLSLEGHEQDTDKRRGKGVYKHVQNIIGKLKSKGIFFSVSLTVTRYNIETVTDEQFIQDLINLGCRMFFFAEFSAIKEGTEDWVLTDKQREQINHLMDSFRMKFPGLFIALPGDEEEFGGCLSAGRGFIHISAEGDLEPCPFSPYSDTNLRDVSLKEALESKFLQIIRQNHDQLSETEGGCALWAKREWVKSLLEQNTSKEKLQKIN
jgi:MoaA/NifB/PqqE/SkfB family radical SAM enzyme